MAQQKTLKEKIWKMLKTFYWKNISGIDRRSCLYSTEEMKVMYPPSFFKIHSPEEAREIMAENRRELNKLLEEAGKIDEETKLEREAKRKALKIGDY